MQSNHESISPTLPIIILVDDSPEDLNLNRILLEKTGLKAQIYGFDSGLQALQMIRDLNQQGSSADLLVTDWHMPTFQGSHFLNRIHQEQLKHFPIVVLSGSFELDCPSQAIRGIIDEVFEKSISIETSLQQFDYIISTFLPGSLSKPGHILPRRLINI